MSDSTLAAISFCVFTIVTGAGLLIDRYLAHKEIMAGRKCCNNDEENQES